MDSKGIRPSRALFNRPKAEASAESPPPKDAGEPGALREAIKSFLAAWPNIRNHPNVPEPSEVAALRAALSATQDGTPGLDEERLARILHEVLPEDAAEHAPHGDRYCDYIADCIVDRYDDPDWPTPRLSTSEPRREDEG